MARHASNAPPVGLIPEYISEHNYNTLRIVQIRQAIDRYTKAEMPIPQEWMDELARRVEFDDMDLAFRNVNKVTVAVSGGVASLKGQFCDPRVSVVIHDYDTEDMDEDVLLKDADGDDFRLIEL